MYAHDRELIANPFAEISSVIMLHEFQSWLQIKIVQNWPVQLAESTNELGTICVFVMCIYSNPHWVQPVDGRRIDPAIV